MLNRMTRAVVLSCLLPMLALAGENAGGTVPDLTLTDGSRQFRLSDASGKYIALHILLPADCPYCARHFADYQAQAASVAGVMHIMVKPGAAADFAAWHNSLPPDPTALVQVFPDPDAAVARAFAVPDGYEFHGSSTHYPALIVLGPDQRELFRYVGRDNTDRLPFARFATRMAEVSRDPALVHFNVAGGEPALDGYDPVSYFNGSPKSGSPDLSSTYRGVTYLFSNTQNRNAFAADPEHFRPAYGGWCATAMADGGRKVEIDPRNYKVTDGRLFLFYKGWKGDARKEWNKDEPNLTRKADAAWQHLVPAPDEPAAGRR